MKTFRVALLISIAACVAPAVRSEASPVVKADLARLQGEWSMVSGVADGYVIPDAMLKNSQRTCQDDVTTVMLGGQLILKAKFTLDPTKTPKTVDYAVIDGPTKGKKHLGIYALDGDTVKFCFGDPDGARPTEFASKTGDRNTATVWQRKKAADAVEKK